MRIPHPKKNGRPSPLHYAIFGRTNGGIFKNCPRVLKLGIWLGGGVWRWLCRHVRRKISAQVDGGMSERSSLRRRWARTSIGLSGNFITILYLLFSCGFWFKFPGSITHVLCCLSFRSTTLKHQDLHWVTYLAPLHTISIVWLFAFFVSLFIICPSSRAVNLLLGSIEMCSGADID